MAHCRRGSLGVGQAVHTMRPDVELEGFPEVLPEVLPEGVPGLEPPLDGSLVYPGGHSCEYPFTRERVAKRPRTEELRVGNIIKGVTKVG
jgi:hypothetical protein